MTTGTASLLKTDRAHIWHPFSSLHAPPALPLITSANGASLYTADGKRIIDAISSWWVNLHGHGHPHVAAAISAQARTLEHVIFAGFTHAPAIHLTENLLSILPPGYSKVFFSDNGSTAVEVALKMAFQYWHNRGVQKRKVIALEGAYHGDTFGAMSVGGRGLFTEPFFPWLFDVEFIPLPADDDTALATLDRVLQAGDVAAFIFEPLIQAAGGMRMYPAGALDKLIARAQQFGAICIADEVFTGFGRTGTRLAADRLHHKPDIIALSKGLTGGFMPLGVTACTRDVAAAFESDDFHKTFFHGHSYTANPIACAAANASFELLTKEACRAQIDAIAGMHERFIAGIRDHEQLRDARSLGTILAIELKTDDPTAYVNPLRKKIYPWFLERGALLRPLGNVMYLVPPYCIGEDDLRYLYDRIEEFLNELK